MTLKEKLEAFEDLDEKQRNIASSKYLATVNLCGDDLKEIIAYLKSKGVNITKAKEIKIGTIALEEIRTKVDNLEDIGAIDLIVEHPLVLTANDKCLAIRRRIMTCRQEGIEYKDENGYLPLIWSDKAWNSVASSLSIRKTETTEPIDMVKEVEDNKLVEQSIVEALNDSAVNLASPEEILEFNGLSNNGEETIGIDEINETRERLQQLKDSLGNVKEDTSAKERFNSITMSSSNEDYAKYAKNLNDTLGNLNFDFANDEVTFEGLNDEMLGGGRRAA